MKKKYRFWILITNNTTNEAYKAVLTLLEYCYVWSRVVMDKLNMYCPSERSRGRDPPSTSRSTQARGTMSVPTWSFSATTLARTWRPMSTWRTKVHNHKLIRQFLIGVRSPTRLLSVNWDVIFLCEPNKFLCTPHSDSKDVLKCIELNGYGLSAVQ